MSAHQRLYIFTGKGGVGKTTLAMAFTLYLKNQGINAKYNCFHQTPEKSLQRELNLPSIEMQVDTSTETYIAKN